MRRPMNRRVEAILAAVADLHRSVGDVDALVKDMLRPPSKRELGRLTHRDNYKDAHRRIVDILAHMIEILTAPSDDGSEQGSPSGDGGVGPIH